MSPPPSNRLPLEAWRSTPLSPLGCRRPGPHSSLLTSLPLTHFPRWLSCPQAPQPHSRREPRGRGHAGLDPGLGADQVCVWGGIVSLIPRWGTLGMGEGSPGYSPLGTQFPPRCQGRLELGLLVKSSPWEGSVQPVRENQGPGRGKGRSGGECRRVMGFGGGTTSTVGQTSPCQVQ